jgi:hypothetical protein
MSTVPADLPALSWGTCSICQAAMQPGERLRNCEACNSRFHAECWQHNEGCGTYGCRNAPAPMKMVMAEGQASGAWGDSKTCPSCGNVLDSAALKCKKCKAAFDGRAPMSPQEYRDQLARKALARRETWMAILVFSMSAVGMFAPITLLVCIAWLVAHRQQFGRAATSAELLVYGSGALSVAYVALMVAVFGLGW